MPGTEEWEAYNKTAARKLTYDEWVALLNSIANAQTELSPADTGNSKEYKLLLRKQKERQEELKKHEEERLENKEKTNKAVLGAAGLAGGAVATALAPQVMIPVWTGLGAYDTFRSGLETYNNALQYGWDDPRTIWSGTKTIGTGALTALGFKPTMNYATMFAARQGNPYARARLISTALDDQIAGTQFRLNTTPYIEVAHTAELPYRWTPGQGFQRVQEGKPVLFNTNTGAKISIGERLGIPKGLERKLVNNEKLILNYAKEFAEKYGYDIPETTEQALLMYKQHNSFFRTVTGEKNYDTLLEMSPEIYRNNKTMQWLQTLSPEEHAKVLATKGYPAFNRLTPDAEGFLDQTVFVSPSLAENKGYYFGNNLDNTVLVLRPFSTRDPLTWHKTADWRIGEKANNGVFIGNTDPSHEVKLATGHLIPVKIAEPTDKGTLLGNYLLKNAEIDPITGRLIFTNIKKSGGKLNYLNLF